MKYKTMCQRVMRQLPKPSKLQWLGRFRAVIKRDVMGKVWTNSITRQVVAEVRAMIVELERACGEWKTWK